MIVATKKIMGMVMAMVMLTADGDATIRLGLVTCGLCMGATCGSVVIMMAMVVTLTLMMMLMTAMCRSINDNVRWQLDVRCGDGDDYHDYMLLKLGTTPIG